jgi:8-oxo-dGTP pyrophosphatase MutT (NUDIX family)
MDWAAGICPITVYRGKVWILLGRDSKDKGGRWSDFTGGKESIDKIPRSTALRELREETGGAVQTDLKDYKTFIDVTPSGKSVYKFVAWIDYDHAIPLKFRNSKDDEKVELGWFELEKLFEIPMRYVFRKFVRDNYESIVEFAVYNNARGRPADRDLDQT